MRIFTVLSLLMCSSTLFAQQGPTPLVLDGHQQRQVISVEQQVQHITYQNLIPGEQYMFSVPDDPSLGGCLPAIEVADTGIKDVELLENGHSMTFTASQTEHNIILKYACSWNQDNPPRHYLSLVCQTCVKKDLNEYMESLAILEVSPGGSPEELVKNVLIGGNCFDVTGVTYNGNPSAIGTFTNGVTNIGFATGMIMATGDVSVAVGPNDQDNASAGFGAGASDPDLTALSGSSSLFDLANIEFDFTPTQTPLSFEFVFASEEYCEYVGSQFNDAFGFFISGPGIAGPFGGAENIAALPGGGYVTINNVNHQSNSGLYVNNTPQNGILCGQNPSFLPSVNEVQFDGYTRRMIAVADVIPCETYHIALKISDVGDGIYDSAVFLREGSFDGGGNAAVEFLVNGDPFDEDVYEGCETAELRITRVGGNAALPMPVTFTVSGSATAGADYTPFPIVVVIPPGQTEIIYPLNIVNDGIIEGTEDIIITLSNPCSCLNPQEILYINDTPELDAVADTTVICGGGVGVLSVTPTGGLEPYTYFWQNGAQTPQITPFVAVSTNYRVTVTDDCGNSVVRTARIEVTPPPTAQLIPPAPQLCPGQTATLTVNFTGNAPFSLQYTINGNFNEINNIYDNPYELVVFEPGLYTVTNVTDVNGCQGPGIGTQLVLESTLDLTGEVEGVLCDGGANGSINTLTLGGQGPYNYNWVGPQPIGNIPDPVNLIAGTYDVTVTDGFGCTDFESFEIIEPTPIAIGVDSIVGTSCATPNGGSIEISVNGGAPNYLYEWSNNDSLQNPQNLMAGDYTVTVTDNNGCTNTSTATVPGDFDPPTVIASPADLLTCVVNSIELDGSGSSNGPGFSNAWSADPGNIVSGGNTLNPIVDQPGLYILTITNDNNGCTAADSVQVAEDITLPNADAGNDQTFTCDIVNINLDGSNSSQGSPFTYQWSASNGGNILSGANTLNPEIGNTGDYTLLVTNNDNGCTQTDMVLVDVDTIAPTPQIAAPGLLTCIEETISLDASGSTPSGQLNFNWTTQDGTIDSGADTPNPVISEPGTYTVEVTNNLTGCTSTASVEVDQSADVPVVLIEPTDMLTCDTEELTLDASNSTSGPTINYTWSAGQGGNIVTGGNTVNPTINAPGEYTLTITNSDNNCSSTNSIIIDQDITPPNIVAGLDQIITCTDPVAQLNGIVNSGSGNYSYSWNGPGIVSGGSTLSPTVNQEGTYSLVVTDLSNGCTSTDALGITADQDAPVVDIAPNGPLTCVVEQLTLDASGSSAGSNFVYDWTGPTLLSGQGTLSPEIDQPGTYSLLITNSSNGCTETQAIDISQDIAPPGADAGPDDVLNCDQPQLVLGGSGNPSGSIYTFDWTGPGILSGANAPDPTVDQGGTYNLLVTNTQNGCTSTDEVALNTDFDIPQADAGSGFQLTCVVEEFTLNATASQGPNFTYLWSTQNGNFTTPNDILNPTVDGAGVYILTVTNTTNGCTNTSDVTITQSSDVPVAIAGTAPILTCAVTEIQLDASGTSSGPSITYTWSTVTGNIVSGNGSLSPTIDQPGTYTLTVFDVNNNCDAVSSVTVIQDIEAPEVDAGPVPTLTCSDPSLSLAAAVTQPGNYAYQWQASGGGNILSGATTLTPLIDAAGNYSLTVTDLDNGCTSIASLDALVDQVDPTAIILDPATLTCTVEQVPLNASGSSVGNMNYTWSTSAGNFVDTSNLLIPVIDQPGTYSLTVTDMDNGCTAFFTVNVDEDVQAPDAAASVDGILTCAITTIDLEGLGSSQGPEYQYSWSTIDGNITGGATSLAPTVNGAGTYELLVTNNINGCTTVAQTTVDIDTITPVLNIAAPGILTCLQPQLTLAGSSSMSGLDITFEWSTANGSIAAGANTLIPTVTQAGLYTLLVTNNATGCSATVNTLVTEDIILPDADAGTPQLLTCSVEEVDLLGSGSTGPDFTYQWSTPNGQILSGGTTLSPVVNQPGTYTLLVTNTATGCTRTDEVLVNIETNLPTDFDYAMQRPTCKDNDGVVVFGEVTGGFGPYLYSLDGGNSFFAEIEFGSLTPGTYQLAIQDANGCEVDQTLIIPQAPDPGVNLIPEVSIALGDELILNAELPLGYPTALIDTVLWDPLEGLTFNSYSIPDLLRPTASPVKLTEYTVTVISGDDCVASDRVLIRVDNEPKIYIPNVFKPGTGSGEGNDKVVIFAKSDQIERINTFQIFDRWGSKVFEANDFLPNDPANGWDGYVDGKLLNPAVFVYYAEIELIDGRVILYKGDVTLVD